MKVFKDNQYFFIKIKLRFYLLNITHLRPSFEGNYDCFIWIESRENDIT